MKTTFFRLKDFLFSPKVLIILVIFISGFAHQLNMFRFPYYESDEGTYMAQAWALLTQGKLAPYTYWYDHAPGGWFLIAIWTLLTGGFFTFGFSVNSGRVLMLVLQLFSTFFVIKIASKLTNNLACGIIAGLFFALTPIGLYFHRRVLLDNMMIFWILLSYYLLVRAHLRLSLVILSAMTFGIGVLTKENAIFFIPGFILTIYRESHCHHRKFALTKWIIIVILIISFYPLYALIKGELFPSGSLLGGPNTHVSLLESLKYQSARGGGSIIDPEHSSFWRNVSLWNTQDPFLITLGAISNILLLLLALFWKRKRHLLGITLVTCGFWLFLARGGITIEFYVIPLIPLLALCIGITTTQIVEITKKLLPSPLIRLIYALLFLVIFFKYTSFSQTSRAFGQGETAGFYIFKSDQTKSQIDAVNWTRNTLNTNDIVVIDNYAYVDFHSPDNPSHKIFPNAVYYWKTDLDPEIHQKYFQSLENLDVIEETPQMSGDLAMNASPTVVEVKKEARILKSFKNDGWQVEIFVPKYPKQILSRSWQSYKKHFITKEGTTLDPYSDNRTTSEGQSYSLLRAVWMNDRQTFDRLWAWTKKNLQKTDGIFAWHWGKKDGKERILDNGTASDGDQDIALALAFASKRWHDDQYLSESKKILTGIWNEEVKNVAGQNYFLAGNWGKGNPQIVVNPSYFSPAAYRVFAEVDPGHNWSSLVTSSYDLLDRCSSEKLDQASSTYLAPEWCALGEDGKIDLPKESGLHSSSYSYNAIRVPWRIALDYLWNKDSAALNYLVKNSFLRSEWQQNQKISVSYRHDGTVLDNYESVVAYGTALGDFVVTNRAGADSIYQQKILPKFYEDDQNSYWEDPKNYYTQNWGWFGTALYINRLPNLWKE